MIRNHLAKLMIGVASLVLMFLSAIEAYADDDSFRCPEHPASQWSSMGTLAAKLAKQGYKVDKIQATQGGCYEVLGKAPSGQAVRLQIDPVILRPLKTDRLEASKN